jgi:hypothetical protein
MRRSIILFGLSLVFIVVGAIWLFKPENTNPPKNLPIVLVVREAQAQILGVSPEEIEVITVEKKVWSNGCFELPTPELCTQELTPGYRITLRWGEQKFAYRTGS